MPALAYFVRQVITLIMGCVCLVVQQFLAVLVAHHQLCVRLAQAVLPCRVANVYKLKEHRHRHILKLELFQST